MEVAVLLPLLFLLLPALRRGEPISARAIVMSLAAGALLYGLGAVGVLGIQTETLVAALAAEAAARVARGRLPGAIALGALPVVLGAMSPQIPMAVLGGAAFGILMAAALDAQAAASRRRNP